MEPARLIDWTHADTDQPMPGITRRRVVGHNAMVSHFTLEEGVVVPVHQHINEQISVVLSGKIRFTLQDQPDGSVREITLTDGMALHLPSQVPHGATAEQRTIILDVFSPVTETTGVDQP